jgi:hypothetical protein
MVDRRVLRALLAGAAGLGAFVAVTPPAGAAAGSCPAFTWAPSGFECEDRDVHTTTVNAGKLETTTDWYDNDSGDLGVSVSGTLSIDGHGDYTAVIQLRNSAGGELGRREVRLQRDGLFEAWWKDASIPVHIDRRIASVRFTVRNNDTGAVSAAKVSRLGD